MTLPSVDSTPQRKQQPSKPVAKQAERDESPKDEQQIIGYVRRRVDVKMTHKHALILHMKLRKLQDEGARLKDGTEVGDHTKAVLWILENEVA